MSISSRIFVLSSCVGFISLWAAGLPVDDAWPMVGTAGHGHTYPGATVPFGFVQLSPDTRTAGWDACSGYNYADSTISGFSHTHLSGTGGADLGEVLIMPVTGSLDKTNYASNFSHDNELARPGYYRVHLDTYGIEAELTATAHCGMHRYTFPASRNSHVLIDLIHGIGDRKPVRATLKMENDRLITGERQSRGWTQKTIYFAIECSRPFRNFGIELDGKPLPAGAREARGKEIWAHLDYRTRSDEKIILRVGLSPTSVEEAKRNLQAEIPGWDFDAVSATASDKWEQNLSRIEIECSNPEIRRTFYSALYHTMVAPTIYNNADGSYFGADKQVHQTGFGAPGDRNFQDYSTFSIWDVYRAEMPLLTIDEPDRMDDMVQSLLAEYQQSPEHLLPHWPLANYDTGSMIGYHAVSIIYDAYAKGFRGFDPELAYQAMRDTAMSGRRRQDEYQKYGFVPWEPPGPPRGGAATSRTLEFAYDDWCIGQMAKALGKTDDAQLFLKRSQNYRNVWDPATQFFRSPKPDGTWLEPFDPLQVARRANVADGYYTEADAWEYMFAVPQDVPGMIALYGGNDAFIRKLDEFFDQDSIMHDWRIDVTGLIGQYSQGNEPDEQCAYLYALAGAQYKTAARVREIQRTQYDPSPEGLDGNDDCGQISAWYVWSALGLYPVNPASGIYVIGSPLVQKAVIHLDPKYYSGGTFTIIVHSDTQYAPAATMDNYIQSATLNGQPLNRPWITQDELVKGGTLELTMGILPNPDWGTGK
ncbi:MAG TPA: GH92 family glycosyl hydrolase [Candidatus Sulfotelmatobacter sp.]|nr:GH92 family glycosyl hydrolase [Candidatus Sulfotelmatobacter sp.]